MRCHERGKASVSYQVQDIHDTGSGGGTEPKHYDEGERGLIKWSSHTIYIMPHTDIPIPYPISPTHLPHSPTARAIENNVRPLATPQYVYDDDAHSAKPNNSSGNVAADHPSPCLD